MILAVLVVVAVMFSLFQATFLAHLHRQFRDQQCKFEDEANFELRKSAEAHLNFKPLLSARQTEESSLFLACSFNGGFLTQEVVI